MRDRLETIFLAGVCVAAFVLFLSQLNSSEGIIALWLFIACVIIATTLLVRRQMRRNAAIKAKIETIRQKEEPNALLDPWGGVRFTLETIGGKALASGRAVMMIKPGQMVLYQRTPEMPEVMRFNPEQLRWFGRPQKYIYGQNEIWLHVEQGESWNLLKIKLHQDDMRELVRELKAVSRPELVTAYRRQRPYIHSGPVKVRPASQDIHGAWTLDEPVELYLMPRFMVLLKGATVLLTIPLEAVQQIGALKRIDQPGADGLVRFRALEETFAFSLPGYDELASALAEAAKRTLEAPLEQKRKGKDDDEDED